MIVTAEVTAVGRSDPVQHSRLQIGYKKLIVGPVESDIAECRAGIAAPIERHRSEHRRSIAIVTVELVDGTRVAVPAPHASHPIGRAGCEMEPERGCGGHKDVGWGGIVESDAEDLPDVLGFKWCALRLVDPMLALRQLLRRSEVDNTADSAIGIDHADFVAVNAFGGFRTGETGHEGLARSERGVTVGRLGHGQRRKKGKGGNEHN